MVAFNSLIKEACFITWVLVVSEFSVRSVTAQIDVLSFLILFISSSFNLSVITN